MSHEEDENEENENEVPRHVTLTRSSAAGGVVFKGFFFFPFVSLSFPLSYEEEKDKENENEVPRQITLSRLATPTEVIVNG